MICQYLSKIWLGFWWRMHCIFPSNWGKTKILIIMLPVKKHTLILPFRPALLFLWPHWPLTPHRAQIPEAFTLAWLSGAGGAAPCPMKRIIQVHWRCVCFALFRSDRRSCFLYLVCRDSFKNEKRVLNFVSCFPASVKILLWLLSFINVKKLY